MNSDLNQWQAQIHALDDQILDLLNRRFQLILDGEKWRQNPEAEQQLSIWEADTAQRLATHNSGPVSAENLHAIYREIMAGNQALRKTLTVAFLGSNTTFTHLAALAKFGNRVHYLARPTIPDVFEAVSRNLAVFGVVPVENSTEGAVTHTLDMFTDSSPKICAEINMAIHHNLLCRCAREELQVIYSHPQVFGQCRKWLHANLPSVPLMEVTSTTEAASRAANDETAGALAGILAAEQFHLPIREANIEDISGNITRFFVIGTGESKPTGNDKTSLLFGVKDRVGALLDSLEAFKKHEVSLSFIESRPSRRKNWEYYFFVDFIGHVMDPGKAELLNELSEHCQFVKILGSYPRAAEILS